jgi:pyruvate dehydrogenase E1 component alpha subunit
MADPEEYRSKEEVAHWRERDPIPAFGALLEGEGILDTEGRETLDREAVARVDAAVQFAEDSPFPAAESLYEDVYMLDQHARGAYH